MGPRRGSDALLIVRVLFVAVMNERIGFKVVPGASALRLEVVAAPVLALIALSAYGRRRVLGFTLHHLFVLGVLPFLLFAAVLPFVGVLANGYGEKTLLSATVATDAFAYLMVGAALAHTRGRSWYPWLLLALFANAAYAALQVAYLAGLPAVQWFEVLRQWDFSFVNELEDFIQARSTGLYLNPNTLGFWAGAATVFVWGVLPDRRKLIAVFLGTVTLILSESRGATIGFLVALGAGAVVSILRREVNRSGVRTSVIFVLLVVCAAAVGAALSPEGSLEKRLASLVAVSTQGAGADANLAGRVEYWKAVIDLNAMYPFGTGGSPEVILGTAIDSSWFRVFAQGSIPFVVTLMAALCVPFFIKPNPWTKVLIMLAMLVAVAGLTQTPLDYPAIALYWVALGAALQSDWLKHAVGPAAPIPASSLDRTVARTRL